MVLRPSFADVADEAWYWTKHVPRMTSRFIFCREMIVHACLHNFVLCDYFDRTTVLTHFNLYSCSILSILWKTLQQFVLFAKAVRRGIQNNKVTE